MSKKTILTILGALVSVVLLLPLPLAVLRPIEFLLGILIIFFTRAKINGTQSQKRIQPKESLKEKAEDFSKEKERSEIRRI